MEVIGVKRLQSERERTIASVSALFLAVLDNYQ